MTSLRDLCQAVEDTWQALCDAPSAGMEYLCAQQLSDDAQRALADALGIPDQGDLEAVARAILAAITEAEERGRREARDVAQRKLDEITSTLDMCSWDPDEAWQIQCHMDSLVDIVNAAGGKVERVAFAPFDAVDDGPRVSEGQSTAAAAKEHGK